MSLGIPSDFKIHPKGLFIQQSPWALNMMNIPKAHALGVKGKGVKIAILDTGYNDQHRELPDPFQIWKGSEFDSAEDRHGHGTGTLYCASLVAPESQYFVGKVMGDNGKGSRKALTQGVYAAVSAGCQVISMSVGGPAQLNYPELNKAIDYARSQNVIVVVSSGNQNKAVGYPARLRNAVSVGAIDSDKAPAIFQNFGIELDVVAPGVRIRVLWQGNTDETVDGTSFSCPFVAGLIALIIEDWVNKYGHYNVDDILRVLYTNCEDLNIPGWDSRTGHGLTTAAGEPFLMDKTLGDIVRTCPNKKKNRFRFIKSMFAWLKI